MTDIYKKLAAHIDTLPTGFPATESGVELRILKHLFSPEEAQLVTQLSRIPEPVASIARRLGRPVEELAPVLEAISKKGLIYRSGKGPDAAYMATQFVIGFWEFNLKNLTPELIRDVNEYLPEFMKKSWAGYDTKQFRVIPVSADVTPDLDVFPYEVAEEIIRKQEKIVVAECICRKEHQIMGHGCGFPLETCLSFGSSADYYEENGMGRAIDQDEALSILDKGREAGLVLQPGNAKHPANICMCCGCCCQVLKNMKKMDRPADTFHTNYYAEVDTDECLSCETCMERCHMDAISMDGDAAVIDMGRCIGCGVCIPACPVDALKLKKKDTPLQYDPPENVFETYYAMARERGNA